MSTGRTAPGYKKSDFLLLDARLLDDIEDIEALREYIKLNRVEYIISGVDNRSVFSNVSIFEQCRALCDLENFDNMYDFTMQVLAGKELTINMKNDDGSKTELGKAYIQDKFVDMQLYYPCIAEYPYLMLWLTEYISGLLSKKFPLPMKKAAQKAAGDQKRRTK